MPVNVVTHSMRMIANGLEKVINPFCKFLAYVAAVLAFAMSLVVVVDVFLRTVFNRPIFGVVELETFLLAIMCFFSLAYTMIKDGHISVDIFKNQFPQKVNLFLDSLFTLLSIYVFILFAWQYVLRVTEAIDLNESDQALFWPMWPFYVLTAVGCGLLALVLLIRFLKKHADLLEACAHHWVWTAILFTIALLAAFFPWLLEAAGIKFSFFTYGIVLSIVLMGLLFLGMPVAFAMCLVGILGTWSLVGLDVCFGMIKLAVYESVANYFFCVVPFFVLMGFLCLKAGMSQNLYDTGYKWFGQIPGGLAIGTIFGCGGFAAICGDSMATAATMGSVALPEMKKYNYDDSLATGAIAAGGTLGILIPPSIGFIAYGIVTQESIGKLFMAGILPGILLTTLFALVIYFRCSLNPMMGPKAPKTTAIEKIQSLKNIWAIAILFVLVIGGIYSGLFTPTEAGGVGVVGAFIIAFAKIRFNWRPYMDALLQATLITSMVAALLIGVTVLGYFITLTEIPMRLAALLAGLNVSRYVLFAMILFLYLILGMVMNIIPMIMLTLPIVYPTIIALGFDPIWFGVIMVIMMEMGQITPPVGINVYVISGVANNVPMGKIFRGVLPFVFVEILIIVVLTIWPEIAMYLPSAMDVLPAISD